MKSTIDPIARRILPKQPLTATEKNLSGCGGSKRDLLPSKRKDEAEGDLVDVGVFVIDFRVI